MTDVAFWRNQGGLRKFATDRGGASSSGCWPAVRRSGPDAVRTVLVETADALGNDRTPDAFGSGPVDAIPAVHRLDAAVPAVAAEPGPGAGPAKRTGAADAIPKP